MGILNIVLVFSLALLSELVIVSASPPIVFNVLNFGAVGNGVADDTEAFYKAWAATCLASTYLATMVVPRDMTFLVMPMTFKGSCNSWKIWVQLDGTVVAPNDPTRWSMIDHSRWLTFQSVVRLSVLGYGEINGRGQNWWNQSCKYNPKQGCSWIAPTAISFIDCSDLWVKGLRVVDSPQMHMAILNSRRVNVANLMLVSYEFSPNTDGIHIQNSRQVHIEMSTIETGDDCISIGDNVYDIKINRIVCGPGHGISIGSLGSNGTTTSVEEVHVKYSNFYGTTNGVRIKTWQGGKGYVRGISFEHCNFTDVENPIIIDQYYCDAPLTCRTENNAIQISNVTYANLQGTSKTPLAIILKCSQSVPCTSLNFDTVNIFSSDPRINVGASCINAYGSIMGQINPNIPCLLQAI